MSKRLVLVFLAFLVVLSFPPSSARAARIWYEHGLASATGGYDPAGNRTLINKFFIVAFGPDDVNIELRNFVRDCVQGASVAGVNAFQDTPGEAGIRLSAAYSAFHGSLGACLTVRKAAQSYISKFELGYIRRGYWEPGLKLKFTAENPATQLYVKIHDAIKDKLPDPVNKLITFYINSQQPPNIDITLRPPKELTHFLAQFPSPPNLARFAENADREARRTGRKIADEVKKEAEKTGHRLGSDAANVAQVLLVVPVTLVGEAAKGAGQVAPGVIEKLSPISQSGGKTTVRPTGPLGPSVTVGDHKVTVQPIPVIPPITIHSPF